MKSKILILAAIVAFSSLAYAVSSTNVKVKLMHKGVVIEVAAKSVAAHLAHGDTVVI
jgi:hypothetical protein